MPASRVSIIATLFLVIPTSARAEDPPPPPDEAPPPEEDEASTDPAEAPAEPADAPVPEVAAGGRGQEPPRPIEPVPAPVVEPEPEPDWDAAPPADRASGIARQASPRGNAALWAPRLAMFLPRWAFWIAVQPLRLGAWAYDRYKVPQRFWGTVFNPERTVGLFPTVEYASHFGITAGVRFVHRDLYGAGERLVLRADFGGRYRQAYGFALESGNRFGDNFKIEVDARYERRPRERFFGIGNLDEVDPPPPGMLVDPFTTSVDTRYREDHVRAIAAVDARLVGPLWARLSGAVMVRDFAGHTETASENNIEDVYMTDRLVGFEDGVENLYLEGALTYDTRRPTSIYQSNVIDATGWLAEVYFGGMTGISDDPSDFFRYGGEVQRFFDLYRGSRILALRVLIEAVGGTDGTTDGEISFADLPELGGHEYLRGYASGQFRDRAITLATAEYTWDLGNWYAAYAFVDTGRPWHSLRDFSFEDFRLGFGGGVQLQTTNSFLFRGQIAASRDGDLFFQLALSPVFGRRERAGRR